MFVLHPNINCREESLSATSQTSGNYAYLNIVHILEAIFLLKPYDGTPAVPLAGAITINLVALIE